MRTIVALLLCSSLALADPADAPRKDELVPMTEREAVACLTCAADLEAANASASKWIAITAAIAVVVGFGIGFGAGYAVQKR